MQQFAVRKVRFPSIMIKILGQLMQDGILSEVEVKTAGEILR